MFCFNEFAFTTQVTHNINSIQYLALFRYVCILRLAISTHAYFAKNVAYLILGSVFSACVVFYGDILQACGSWLQLSVIETQGHRSQVIG